MTASVDGQTCQQAGTITVTASSANFALEYWVPASAHAPGSLGSQWRTDLGLFNPGDSATAVRIDFHEGATIHSMSRTLGAGTSDLLVDVIGLYNVTASGALEVLAEQEVFVTSRTYNEGTSGTFGSSSTAATQSRRSAMGKRQRCPSCARTSLSEPISGCSTPRTATRWFKSASTTATGPCCTASSEPCNQASSVRKTRPFANLAGRSDLVRGYAIVTVTSGAGVLAYASVIDNQTQDPTTIPMKGSAAEIGDGWVAAAAHAPGSLGSQWRTDLGLLNRRAHRQRDDHIARRQRHS